MEADGLDVSFDSPSIGQVQFGWQGELLVKGEKVELHNYPRFDNPYCEVEFGSKKIKIEHQGQRVEIEF